MAPVNDHLNILLPLKGAAQLLFEIGIRPPHDDRHHPSPWFRWGSNFGGPHKKSWQKAHYSSSIFKVAVFIYISMQGAIVNRALVGF
jgi:hypothetical protein